jgi:hypothetical protein
MVQSEFDLYKNRMSHRIVIKIKIAYSHLKIEFHIMELLATVDSVTIRIYKDSNH